MTYFLWIYVVAEKFRSQAYVILVWVYVLMTNKIKTVMAALACFVCVCLVSHRIFFQNVTFFVFFFSKKLQENAYKIKIQN
jgi:hypothetical protein